MGWRGGDDDVFRFLSSLYASLGEVGAKFVLVLKLYGFQHASQVSLEGSRGWFPALVRWLT